MKSSNIKRGLFERIRSTGVVLDFSSEDYTNPFVKNEEKKYYTENYYYNDVVSDLNEEESIPQKKHKKVDAESFNKIHERIFSAMENEETYHKFLEDYGQNVKTAPKFKDVSNIMIDNCCIVINTKEL